MEVEHENVEGARHGGVRIDATNARWSMWGEIDGAVRARYADQLTAHLVQAPDTHLTVDLSEVTFFDSGGLRLLYTAAELVPTPPVLVGVSDNVRDILRITGVESMFRLQD